jgi:hypothetical protein
MQKVLVAILIAPVAALTVPVSEARQKTAEGQVSDPAGVELRLVVKKDRVVLDLAGKTDKDLAGEHQSPPLPPPEVDFALEFHNSGKKPVTIWIGGDPTCRLNLDLKGPGAKKVKIIGPPIGANIFPIPPREEKIEPGKAYLLPLKSLAVLNRYRAGEASYWTKPGEYTLRASYHTALSPAPKGSKEAVWLGPLMVGVDPKAKSKGFGQVTFTSNTVKLKVVEK